MRLIKKAHPTQLGERIHLSIYYTLNICVHIRGLSEGFLSILNLPPTYASKKKNEIVVAIKILAKTSFIKTSKNPLQYSILTQFYVDF